MVGVLDGLRLAALVEVGGEAEASLGVLDDAAELPPAPQRLLGRVLALDAPEVLLQVALHAPSTAAAAAGGLPARSLAGLKKSLPRRARAGIDALVGFVPAEFGEDGECVRGRRGCGDQ